MEVHQNGHKATVAAIDEMPPTPQQDTRPLSAVAVFFGSNYLRYEEDRKGRLYAIRRGMSRKVFKSILNNRYHPRHIVAVLEVMHGSVH